MRIAKRIAQSSHLSRRQAEQAILDGRVCVDGHPIETPAYVVTETHHITLDGHSLLAPPKPMVWALYKPRGCLVTREDPRGRDTVFDVCTMPQSERLITVGRLDFHSEGLLLITNTPALAHTLETSSLERCYRVWVDPPVFQRERLDVLRKGTCIDGIVYQPCQIIPEAPHILRITLTEGKNREIRILLQSIGLHVQKLLRLSFGEMTLGSLRVGQWHRVPEKIFRRFL